MRWLDRLLGRHVCSEFTQWTRLTNTYTQTHAYSFETGRHEPMPKPLDFTRSWQERRCTTCGKIFQEELEYRISPEKVPQ